MKPLRHVGYTLVSLTAWLCIALAAHGQEPATTQTETDEYTLYELLAPESASFAIRYEVTATAPGATVYYNPIRKGSVARDESVLDALTGDPLTFEVVSGEDAVKDPLLKGEDASVDYIKVHLARPVPPQGQARLLILKTYKDPKSYYREGDAIVFNRALSIPRNKVILPEGYELVACNVPSQVLPTADGRISISFMNGSGAEAPLVVKAKRGAQAGTAVKSADRSYQDGAALEVGPETLHLTETAHRDQESVLQLQQPETHTYRRSVDYTANAEAAFTLGVSGGTKVTDASAYILDTGEKLKVSMMTAAAAQTTGAVVVPSPPQKSGKSVRVRVLDTETAPTVLRLLDGELVFSRVLEYPRNAVILPDGWYVTATSLPATVSQMHDGRIRLDFWNDRPAPVEVLVTGNRRPSAVAGGAGLW